MIVLIEWMIPIVFGVSRSKVKVTVTSSLKTYVSPSVRGDILFSVCHSVCPSVRLYVCPSLCHTYIPDNNWRSFWPTFFKLHRMIVLIERMIPIVFGVSRSKIKVTVTSSLKTYSG